MSNVLDIDTLRLTDIVWPSAHNAGMDKKAPNYEVIVGKTTCRNDTFAWQQSNLVLYCWSANSMKAVYGDRLHARL